jgi:hypothetical protein
MNKKNELVYWWIPVTVLCLIAYWIQINTYLYKDTTILSHLAGLMLQGQTYGHYIYEINPPLILYLQIPPIIITKLTGIKIIYCLPAYFICLILGCLACAHYLFKKLFKQNTHLIYLMSYTLACVLLFQSESSFGQREHLLIILTMPYLLLAACRLENRPVKKILAVLIGVMAGIGFSIKPFFVLTLFFIELLFVYRQKNIFGWLRIESIIASLIVLFYGLVIVIFYRPYWQIVLPLLRPYLNGIVKPWDIILTYGYFLFCFTATVMSLFTKKIEPNSTVKRIFSLALIGYLISFLIPRVAWYYHILPALSITYLYFVLILGEIASQKRGYSTRIVDWVMIGLFGIVIFINPVTDNITTTRQSIAYFRSDSTLNKLASFLDQYQPNNSYIFFSMTHELSNLEFYSTANYVGSFACFWWEYMRLSPQRYSTTYQQNTTSYVLNILSDELNNKKTQFVIIDRQSSMRYLEQDVDYVKDYSNNESFRKAWSQYTYASTIGEYEIYQRKPG